jgi:hypothetical protein
VLLIAGGWGAAVIDKYVGDVGDYYKFALLRHLTGVTVGDTEKRLRLGVIWYRTLGLLPEGAGENRAFLEPRKEARFQPLDPPLYAALAPFVDPALRTFERVAISGILPPETLFFPEPLSMRHLPQGAPEATAKRKSWREAWLGRAISAIRGSDLAFVDPDNGLEAKTTEFHLEDGARYVFYSELRRIWAEAQSLVIYQQKARVTTQSLVRECTTRLKAELPGAAFVEAVDMPNRVFFVVAQAEHAPIILNRLGSFCEKAKGLVSVLRHQVDV